MKVAVLGTGVVGKALAGRLAETGHEVTIGTRDPAATMAVTDPDGYGNPPIAAWFESHEAVQLKTFSDAAADAELVINATNGSGSLAALQEAGSSNLRGKVLIDVSNPLDFSQGFPPTLGVKDTDSLAEQIQRAFPEARVVKSLNTVTASVMIDPGSVGDGDTTVFAASDDPDAREQVVGLLRELGWKDIIELDGLQNARGLEMWLPLWVRLLGALGTSEFNIKVVRSAETAQ